MGKPFCLQTDDDDRPIIQHDLQIVGVIYKKYKHFPAATTTISMHYYIALAFDINVKGHWLLWHCLTPLHPLCLSITIILFDPFTPSMLVYIYILFFCLTPLIHVIGWQEYEIGSEHTGAVVIFNTCHRVTRVWNTGSVVIFNTCHRVTRVWNRFWTHRSSSYI